ncbi:hypothetical protein [Carboxydothermus pertinax]|uniref:Uncharacterized protein n=1 Tax=Carboxydothermus pertinax TaxID=870242 RepID=A0A1L8CX93_9THEO|nr:hypothetical protein [Carboxydothermus pertinax]GAV23520.1 hypothetical protein cpu_20300 [Carboxydothermus pertinax]
MDNEVNEAEPKEIAQDVALLYEKAIFAVDLIPEGLLKNKKGGEGSD